MNIKDMSAEQRKEELARLADAVKAAKAETKTAKTRVAEGKDAVKGAKKAACQAATAKVAEAVAREADFRAEAKAIEDAEKAEADQARREAEEAAAEQARKADPFKALAEKYAKAYPDCKAFHITSDRQVFLDKDKNLAQYHQKGLGEGEVRTINVR
jgi:hypothetical protein